MKMQTRICAAVFAGACHVALAASLFASLAAYGQSNDPCASVAAAKERQWSLEQQIAREPNPLRREDLKARLNEARATSTDAIERVKTADQGRFGGLTGRVAAFDPVSYNGSHGYVLVIALPCGTKLSFRFREITNPTWGGMDPNHDTPLAPWRKALETIIVGDTVTVSGQFENKFFFDSLAAVLTRLQKRGGPVYEAAGPQQNNAPQANAATPSPQRNATSPSPSMDLVEVTADGCKRFMNRQAVGDGSTCKWTGSCSGGYEVGPGVQACYTAGATRPYSIVRGTKAEGRFTAGSTESISLSDSGELRYCCAAGKGPAAMSADELPEWARQFASASGQTGNAISHFECARADSPSVTTTLVVDFKSSTVLSLNGFGGLRAPTSAQISDATISWRNQVVKNYGGGGMMNFAGSIDRATRDFTFTTADNNKFLFKCR